MADLNIELNTQIVYVPAGTTVLFSTKQLPILVHSASNSGHRCCTGWFNALSRAAKLEQLGMFQQMT